MASETKEELIEQATESFRKGLEIIYGQPATTLWEMEEQVEELKNQMSKDVMEKMLILKKSLL